MDNSCLTFPVVGKGVFHKSKQPKFGRIGPLRMQDVYKMDVSSPVPALPHAKEPKALSGALLPFNIPLHVCPSSAASHGQRSKVCVTRHRRWKLCCFAEMLLVLLERKPSLARGFASAFPSGSFSTLQRHFFPLKNYSEFRSVSSPPLSTCFRLTSTENFQI